MEEFLKELKLVTYFMVNIDDFLKIKTITGYGNGPFMVYSSGHGSTTATGDGRGNSNGSCSIFGISTGYGNSNGFGYDDLDLTSSKISKNFI